MCDLIDKVFPKYDVLGYYLLVVIFKTLICSFIKL
jgi:hypothetical protein